MIALLGGCGSIGSRYAAIMRHYGIEHEIFDTQLGNVDQVNWDRFDKALIATPTASHLSVMSGIPEHIPVLCEKPVSKTLDGIPTRKNAYMVSNYRYVLNICQIRLIKRMSYDYYKTGSDGIYWDCCQLLYLDPSCRLNNVSPRWNLNINGYWVKYRDVEESYCRMIQDFSASNYRLMWTMEDARRMVKVVLERKERDEHYNSYTG